MEAFAQRLFDVVEAQRFQFGLCGGALRHRLERPGDILAGQRVAGQGGDRISLQGLPGRVVQFTGDGQAVRRLETRHRAPLVAAHFTVDLAGREIRAIQQHLGMQGGTCCGVRSGLLGDGGGQSRGRCLRERRRCQQRESEHGGSVHG